MKISMKKFNINFAIYGSYYIICISLGKDSAGQMILNQDTEETKLVDSPDKVEKSDIPLTMIDS